MRSNTTDLYSTKTANLTADWTARAIKSTLKPNSQNAALIAKPSKKAPIQSVLVVAMMSVVALMAGCSQKHARTQGKGYVNVPKQYQVQTGDTVAKIAQRYGLDWRSLSKTNKLNADHTIYVGQWLTLKGVHRAEKDKTKTNQSQSATTTQIVRKKVPVPSTQSTQQTTSTKVNHSASNTSPVPSLSAVSAQNTPTPPVQTNAAARASNAWVGSSALMKFNYPVSRNNPVVKNFASPTQNGLTEGIFFSGRDGDKVTASMAGKVVGVNKTVVRPYVTIDHDNGYQTTYFDLKNITVDVGQTLNKNDTLGLMQSQTPSGLALFEFRVLRQGQYIDPVSVLK